MSLLVYVFCSLACGVWSKVSNFAFNFLANETSRSPPNVITLRLEDFTISSVPSISVVLLVYFPHDWEISPREVRPVDGILLFYFSGFLSGLCYLFYLPPSAAWAFLLLTLACVLAADYRRAAAFSRLMLKVNVQPWPGPSDSTHTFP